MTHGEEKVQGDQQRRSEAAAQALSLAGGEREHTEGQGKGQADRELRSGVRTHSSVCG